MNDRWTDQLDKVDLRQGDAIELLDQLEPGSIDALITDPPYSSGGLFRADRSGTTGEKYTQSGYGGRALVDFAGDNRDQRSFLKWSNLWLGGARRVLKPGAVVLVFSDWRQLPIMTDALQVAGYVWRGVVPWNKIDARPQKGRFTATCEYVVWGSAGPMPFDRGVPALPGFYSCVPPRKREHQTQKPLELMRQLVRISPAGGTILDPFMGAGTTGVAAVLEGRRFLGIELIDEHFATATRRISEALGEARETGDQATLL